MLVLLGLRKIKKQNNMVVYRNLQFPSFANRSYFFSNFVTSIDGRSIIKSKPEYVPLGSPLDFETFLDLRKYADALVHGKHTAAQHRTIETIAQKPFLHKRNKQGKSEILPYFIVSNYPDETLLPALINTPMKKPYLVTNNLATVPKPIADLAIILRIGEKKVHLGEFAQYLFQQGYRNTLVEGGATLMGSLLSENLIDEIFLTLAPKILNGRTSEFLTMTEGQLIDADTLPKWELLSVKNVKNEVFLRYRRRSTNSA
jgi:riboflavin biosynthesis pyrimidine reductase